MSCKTNKILARNANLDSHARSIDGTRNEEDKLDENFVMKMTNKTLAKNLCMKGSLIVTNY